MLRLNLVIQFSLAIAIERLFILLQSFLRDLQRGGKRKPFIFRV